MTLDGTCPPCAWVEGVAEEEAVVVEEEVVGEGEAAEMRTDPWKRIVGKKGVAGFDLLRKRVPKWLVGKVGVEGMAWNLVAFGAVFLEMEGDSWMSGKVGVRVEGVVREVELGWMLVELGLVFSKAALDFGPHHLSLCHQGQ